jgi:hypothetical protein
MSFGKLRIVSQVELSFSLRKAAFNFCLRPFFALLLSSPLYATEITLETQVGFHGLFHLGHPFPLKVELTNMGLPVEGTVEVTVWKGGAPKGIGAFPIYYRREIFLSAQARKVVQFTVDPGSISRPLTARFHSPRGSVLKEVDLRRHFSPSPLTLLLTESSLSPSLSSIPGSANPLISLSPAELPPDPRGYGGVSALILYEASLRELSKAQTMALESWLSSGGRILILGSMLYALYQEPSISRFLPVRVTGLKRFTSLPSLEKIYGAKASPLRNLVAQDSRLVEGRNLIAENGAPILAEMARGKGKVLYLSLDVGRPPLSRWEGLSLLFTELMGSPVDGRAPLSTNWDEAVFSQMLSNPAFISSYVPLSSFLLWLLFYLSGLGVLAWLWQRQRLRGRNVASALVSLVVVSSFGGYFHFIRGGQIPDGLLVTATLLDAIADGYVEAQSNVALFSTQGRDYNLVVESGWSDFEPVVRRSARSQENALVVLDEENLTRFRFPLREWDYRLFRMRSVSRFPVLVELGARGDKRLLKLTNLASQDLTECWLVLAGQRFFLGDLLSGSSQVREFPLSALGSSSEDGAPKEIDLRDISFKERTQEFLFRYSFFPQDQGLTRWGRGGALFFGWVKGAPRRVWIEGERILARDFTLFRVVFPSDEEEEG